MPSRRRSTLNSTCDSQAPIPGSTSNAPSRRRGRDRRERKANQSRSSHPAPAVVIKLTTSSSTSVKLSEQKSATTYGDSRTRRAAPHCGSSGISLVDLERLQSPWHPSSVTNHDSSSASFLEVVDNSSPSLSSLNLPESIEEIVESLIPDLDSLDDSLSIEGLDEFLHGPSSRAGSEDHPWERDLSDMDASWPSFTALKEEPDENASVQVLLGHDTEVCSRSDSTPVPFSIDQATQTTLNIPADAGSNRRASNMAEAVPVTKISPANQQYPEGNVVVSRLLYGFPPDDCQSACDDSKSALVGVFKQNKLASPTFEKGFYWQAEQQSFPVESPLASPERSPKTSDADHIGSSVPPFEDILAMAMKSSGIISSNDATAETVEACGGYMRGDVKEVRDSSLPKKKSRSDLLYSSALPPGRTSPSEAVAQRPKNSRQMAQPNFVVTAVPNAMPLEKMADISKRMKLVLVQNAGQQKRILMSLKPQPSVREQQQLGSSANSSIAGSLAINTCHKAADNVATSLDSFSTSELQAGDWHADRAPAAEAPTEVFTQTRCNSRGDFNQLKQPFSASPGSVEAALSSRCAPVVLGNGIRVKAIQRVHSVDDLLAILASRPAANAASGGTTGNAFLSTGLVSRQARHETQSGRCGDQVYLYNQGAKNT